MITFCLNFWDFPNLEGQIPAFLSPVTGWASYIPGIGFVVVWTLSWLELMLWLTVSRPIRLGVGHPFGAHNHIFSSRRSKFEVTLQLTVSQSVSQSVIMSWCRAPLWDLRPDSTSCRSVAVWNLWSSFCGAPSLTRGRVCNLQCNHSMARVAQNP
jgi:hypothetical protein